MMDVIAESKSNLLIGCRVISELKLLFKQSLMKSLLEDLIFLNSGKYLPACLINQIDLQEIFPDKIVLRLLINI